MNVDRQYLKGVFARIFVSTGLLNINLQWIKNKALILMYHKINNFDDPVGLSIPPEIFEQQIILLKKYFDIVTLDELIVGNNRTSGSRPKIALTFDDGYSDNYENAFPLVLEHHIPITIFVSTAFISGPPLYWETINSVVLNDNNQKIDLSRWGGGIYLLKDSSHRLSALGEISRLIKSKVQPEAQEIIKYLTDLSQDDAYRISTMLSWDQVRKMQKSGLVSFGSHTVNHHILTKMDESSVKYELLESYRHIKSEVGVAPRFLAYPNGSYDDYNSAIETLVSNAGYEASFTTIPDIVGGEGIFSQPRIDVTRRMSCDSAGDFFPELFLFKILGPFLSGLKFRVS